jgi:glycosyltransferase involved in cell wall biosynthesis
MAHAVSDKKRVLYLVDKSGFGGVQTIAYTLIERGVFEDVEMFFFFLRNINTRFKMEDIVKPNVYYSKSSRRYSLLPFFEILKMVRRRKVDILHLNGNKSVIFGVLLKMLFFPRLRLVAHEHGGVFDYTTWYPLFLKLSRRWIDLFVTVSNYRKKFLVSRSDIDPDRVRVLNNFVDPARLGADSVTTGPRDRSDGQYVIGYVGGLSRIKGCDVLIKAIPLLKEQISNIRVVIAGDGPARGELEELAERLGVRQEITFLGFVEKPGKVYACFDLMVIPSRSEEGPICLYEAWLMGVPVVASNAHVLDERVRDGDTGIFFESENSEDLAEKVTLAYWNTEIATRISDGGLREVVRHSVKNYLNSLREMYLSL